MQTHFLPNLIESRGGRIASPRLRETTQQCEDFTGLEEGVNRYDLLLLVKRVGKAGGFSPRMIALLDYYMSFTRDIDWEEGSRPIIYKSLAATALDMGVSERQIQALEKQLFEIGAISWNDSGNHRRYGQRCDETGRILYAFGVELTPLAYLRAELQEKLHEKQLRDQAWLETKRQISYYRRQIRAILVEAQERVGDSTAAQILDEADIVSFSRRYDEIAGPIRTYKALDALRELLGKHKTVFAALDAEVAAYDQVILSQKDSSKDDSNCAHYKHTKNPQIFKKITSRPTSNFLQEGVAEDPRHQLSLNTREKDRKRVGGQDMALQEDQDIISETGLQHVTLKQLLNIASERFMEHFPIENRPMNHNDFIEAAYRLKNTIGISQNSWGHACMTLGRIGATVCVILTDQANLREENRVIKPGAYFNAMINRAKTGDLKLHQSIMGHLKRDNDNLETAHNNNQEKKKW